jgi:tellurite resistance protein
MRIDETETSLPGGIKDYNVRFEERRMEDIMSLDDGRDDEKAFYTVAAVSDINDKLYQTFVGPWVRMVSNERTAEIKHWLHPLRMSRYGFSDLNPFMLPIRFMASQVGENRRPVNPENGLLAVEKSMSALLMAGLDWYRDVRDAGSEFFFRMAYDNPWMDMMFPETRDASGETPGEKAISDRAEERAQEDDREKWLGAMEKGGYAEGMIRVISALAGADASFDQREFKAAEDIILADERLREIGPDDLKQMAREQSRILATDPSLALISLKKLLTTPRDRANAMETAQKMAESDLILSGKEKTVMDTMKKVLAIDEVRHGEKTRAN